MGRISDAIREKKILNFNSLNEIIKLLKYLKLLELFHWDKRKPKVLTIRLSLCYNLKYNLTKEGD